jgi:magnesium transporter
MKVLTMIATIMMPLTLISGIYGMNFKYMPILQWEYGFITISAVMVVIGIGMLIWFKRKEWI